MPVLLGPPSTEHNTSVPVRARLSAEARAEIQQLCERRPWQILRTASSAWLVIAAAIALGCLHPHPAVIVFAVCVVATRQNVLALLVHEQAHCTGFRASPGDLLINLLAAFPLLLATVEDYARVHLAHHAHFFTSRDPDFIRKSGGEWDVPMTPRRFALLVLTDLLGMNVLKLVRGKRLSADSGVSLRRASPRLTRVLFFAAVVAVLTWLHAWPAFLLFWVLPLTTVLQVLVRWGALCEHYYNRPFAPVEECTPIILPRWWENLMMPNLNFTLHLYHHYYPGIPFCNLPAVHRVFEREGLVDRRHVFAGHLAYLRFLLFDETTHAAHFS